MAEFEVVEVVVVTPGSDDKGDELVVVAAAKAPKPMNDVSDEDETPLPVVPVLFKRPFRFSPFPMMIF